LEKIKVPKDWSRISDGFFSHLFHFTSSKAWVYLSLIFAFGVMSFLGIKEKDVSNFGWLFGILILLFIGLPLFFRIKYFKDIPKGWTRDQFKKMIEIEGKTQKIVDGFSRKYWLVVFGICALIIGLGIAFNDSGIDVLVPTTLTISFFVYIATMVWRTQKPMSKAQAENTGAVYKASYEAKYGKLGRKLGIHLGIVFLILVSVWFLLVGIKLPQLNETDLIIFVIGFVSLVIGLAFWRSSKNDGVSNNEKVMTKLVKNDGTNISDNGNWLITIYFGESLS
jgi:hypothetical protein